MTAPWEDAPEGPPPGQLSAVLAGLLAESRRERRVATTTLTSGLILTVTTEGGDAIALSRAGGRSDMHEATTVAAQVGWRSYDTEWVSRRKGVYLVLRPAGAPPDAAVATADVDADPPDAVIRALLARPGPWHEASMSLQDPASAREQVLNGFRRCQLRDFLTWARRKWPDKVARGLLDLELEQSRAQLREALR
ncbi:hypothetical protein [Deinococcus rufus]|uniref:Uncharacterized protein n=1 Tax=Deinococcus rufus TaxID=2136097 RepID=A0ABV7Z9R4_9DEIO